MTENLSLRIDEEMNHEDINCARIVFFDDSGDEYNFALKKDRLDCLLHAINEYRAHYCVFSHEFKVLSNVFEDLMFIREQIYGNEVEDDI